MTAGGGLLTNFGPDSDVYVWVTETTPVENRWPVLRADRWECCYCSLTTDRMCFATVEKDRMVGHLEQHRDEGHKVPPNLIPHVIHQRVPTCPVS